MRFVADCDMQNPSRSRIANVVETSSPISFAKGRIRPLAVAGLSAFWLLSLSIAHAATVEITGPKFVQFPGYGTDVDKNNVVNFDPPGPNTAILSDPDRVGWRAQGNGKSGASAVISNLPNYAVDWYFVGAESGDTIKFMSQSLQFQESNQNNSYNPGNDSTWWKIGTTTGSGQGQPIPFTLIDTNPNPDIVITNGANHKPGSYVASLMFAYVEPVYNNLGALKGWKLTKNPTDWFAFGYDDPGSANNDHDDMMIVGYLHATPIPGALGLMGSFLGGGYLVGRWRRWRARRPSLAVS